jgi:UDP-N-acetylmuramate dehydrogenase
LFSKKDCLFEYRRSFFKGNLNFVIFSAILKLSHQRAEIIKEKIEKCIEHRNKTQPKLPNAGSIFKNIDFDYMHKTNKGLAEHARDRGAVINGAVPAGWLIDYAGLKGKTIGGAKVSLEHANFIVNTSKASSEDVAMLISFIKQQIRVLYKIQLQEEVQYFGY